MLVEFRIIMIQFMIFLMVTLPVRGEDKLPARVVVSSEDLSHQLTPISDAAISWSSTDEQVTSGEADVIRIQEGQTYQSLLGIGSSFEHTTCYNLSRLTDSARRKVIEKLVSADNGIGMNLMRICMGTPDFTGEDWYSYDDTVDGKPDPQLKFFSIEKDRAYVLPVLKMALQENPELRFFASPWSPPGWMTTTNDMIGGKLQRQYYAVYADYFVRFIRAYAAEGIPIHAVTVQNEPGVDRSRARTAKWKYPSCRWTGEDERDFIRDHLGPALMAAGIATEIWSYDHNFNVKPTGDGDDPGIDYPTIVLTDPQSARFVRGVAFHGYAGSPEGMSLFSKRFPGQPIYFTEGSTFGVRGADKIIDYFSNGASSYNAWVTMIDENRGPNNGPFRASRTCITTNSEQGEVDYHFDYYMYGQFAKYIDRGAVRIGTSSEREAGKSVAFRNPDGSCIIILTNPREQEHPVQISWRDKTASFTVPPKSVSTVRLSQ